MPPVKGIAASVLAAALIWAAPATAADAPGAGFEVGARVGYGWAAGQLGAPPNGTNSDVGDFVGGQWPIWLDAGYRFTEALYLGGYFNYGFGIVNDDRQDGCRNANVDCSASDVRLGVMGRYHLPLSWSLRPWAGLGVGYEWGSFSVRQSVIGNTTTDSSWSGFEFANLQVGADYHVAPKVALAPFLSVSIGQFQSTSVKTTTGQMSNTTDQDLAEKSLHEWILIGVRVAFMP
jgi:opacity protein-like surface antigen